MDRFFLIGTAIKEREERLLQKVYNGKNSESFHKYPPICRPCRQAKRKNRKF